MKSQSSLQWQARPRVRFAALTRRSQSGAATLIVVMVLFFIISLVAAYTSRNLIFEQRTANNQYRSTQALETAEAGLEWAISMLNFSRIGPACVASASTADTSFRQRYLNVDISGRISPVVALEPTCVSDGAGGWTCSCPTVPGPSTLTPASTTQVLPAFRVRFQRVMDAVNPALATNQPGVVRVQVVGCTRLDTAGDPCLTFDGQGAFNEARVVVSAMLALTGGASSPPQAALTARGNVAITGVGYSAYNTGAAGSGVTVHAGGTISEPGATKLVSSAGNPGGTVSVIASDSAFSAGTGMAMAPLPVGAGTFSTSDRMFAAYFNMRPEAMRAQQAAIELVCPCNADDVRAKATLNPGRPIWVAGDLDVTTAGDIGSATEPVLLVVNGNLLFTLAGVNIYGLVYMRTNSWATSGAGQITGAAVAEGAIAGDTTATFAFDTDVMQRLRWNTGTFVRVPSSWKDFR